MKACQAVLGLCALVSVGFAQAPSTWPAAEYKRYVELNGKFGQPKLQVIAKTAMIAATTGPLAIHSGLKVLEMGGSAVDAAAAISLAQIVLSGGSWNSFAGIFNMVYYDAKTKKVYCLNAGYDTFKEETEPLTIPAKGKPSGRTAMVPGYIAGVTEAQKRFGKLTRETVFAAAIDLAEKGIPVDYALDLIINSRKDVITRLPEMKAILTKPDGSFYKLGETFKQTDLASTLRKVAALGPDYIYKGAWAKKFVSTIKREGGKATLEDLSSYKATWSEPLHAKLNGADVYTVGILELGGVQLVEALNLVEADHLSQKGSPTSSARALFDLIQIGRIGHINSYLMSTPYTDAAFENRVKPEAAIQTLKKLKQPKTVGAIKVGNHSDGIVVVDKDGNIAALVHSSNDISWGTTGIFVDGISIPDSASFQQDFVLKAGPGKRFPNRTNPTIVLRDGKPVLACSAVGAGLHETMLQGLVYCLLYGKDPKATIDSPTYWLPDFTGKGFEYQTVNKGAFPADVLESVRKMGQQVLEIEPKQGFSLIGYWIGVQLDPATRELKGAVNPILNGIVEGY